MRAACSGVTRRVVIEWYEDHLLNNDGNYYCQMRGTAAEARTAGVDVSAPRMLVAYDDVA